MPAATHLLARSIDAALEATIAGSWSRIGYLARRATAGWEAPPRLDGRRILVTGASSGLGRATARQLSVLGADVLLVGRDRDRLDQAAVETKGQPIVCDLVERGQLDDLIARLVRDGTRLDGVVHSAGALFAERKTDSDGVELTVATHVLAPFRFTERLHQEQLTPDVSILVSSGGMYTQEFDIAKLEMAADGYKGAVAYARAKRAQITLAREWSRRFGIHSYSMHPGWAATPGVTAALPGFARLGPMLRHADEGADTITWLMGTASTGNPPPEGFYFDRRRRGEYYRPGTRHSQDQERIDERELWAWCESRR